MIMSNLDSSPPYACLSGMIICLPSWCASLPAVPRQLLLVACPVAVLYCLLCPVSGCLLPAL
jgi:hypothetical protein